ncbi:CPBP family intramembrane metalloprotease [Gilvimarinus sp. SDUM040013]|uniref:CPBP family intramembrane glutamic endopeptidase n=1 Tax=Gilvimarinus gilvus TaxID=3058038 RepID=A0ABU4S354_9GAMM|nr:CPBP family intramembrane glutamic endopeptidase [Gilvimarinus sp. SDUM040013]MDO3384699.1 CPBP family intramembrane metalloprotease [Gilvimarinus sp. SDUM040013]MDX6850826.1 CPBP family intramembrane glutamic endopeptidase [Gilvimarinus sp. SDUM040013]
METESNMTAGMISPADSVKSEPESEPRLPTPGKGVAWFTLFALVYLISAVMYFFGVGFYAAASQPELSPAQIQTFVTSHAESLQGLSGMYIVQFVCLVPMVLLASRFKSQGWRQTLALHSVMPKQLLFWLGIWGSYQAVAITLHYFVDVDRGAFLQQMSGSGSLLITAVVVLLAPILEEIIFRGYLFKAWRHSAIGLTGTLFVTSALFVSLHLGQYGWILLTQLFVFAIILGLAREKTGSLVTPWVLHLANNLFASLMITYIGVEL